MAFTEKPFPKGRDRLRQALGEQCAVTSPSQGPSHRGLFQGGAHSPHPTILWILTLAVTFLLPLTGGAHEVHLFAQAKDGAIKGRAYFPDGSPVKRGQVKLFFGQEDEPRKVTTISNKGRFNFELDSPEADCSIVAELPSGHRATYTPSSDAFITQKHQSATAAHHKGNANNAGEEPKTTSEGHDRTSGENDAAAKSKISQQKLSRLITETVRNQVAPLREQIQRYEHRIRFRDILGGLGWIAGVAGVAFYLTASRRTASRKTGSSREEE